MIATKYTRDTGNTTYMDTKDTEVDSPLRSAVLRLGLAVVACLVSLVVPALEAQQLPVFKSGVDLVNFGVTVTDRKGALVTDLTADDFEILEDGKPQVIRAFSPGIGDEGSGQPMPEMHLGLMLDISESMGEDMKFTKTAAVTFLNTLTAARDVTLVAFDTEVRVARYEQDDYKRLIERIREQKTANGWTALYDAIGVYLDGASGQDGRKIMLLYTDGGDNRSAMRFGELVDLLKASDVTVYAIGELEHQSANARNEQQRTLQQIADLTGGKAFFPLSARGLDSAYDQVLAEIRAQYTVGYVSTNETTNGAWRKVEIKVKRAGNYRVRARKGYFAPSRK